MKSPVAVILPKDLLEEISPIETRTFDVMDATCTECGFTGVVNSSVVVEIMAEYPDLPMKTVCMECVESRYPGGMECEFSEDALLGMYQEVQIVPPEDQRKYYLMLAAFFAENEVSFGSDVHQDNPMLVATVNAIIQELASTLHTIPSDEARQHATQHVDNLQSLANEGRHGDALSEYGRYAKYLHQQADRIRDLMERFKRE